MGTVNVTLIRLNYKIPIMNQRPGFLIWVYWAYTFMGDRIKQSPDWNEDTSTYGDLSAVFGQRRKDETVEQ